MSDLFNDDAFEKLEQEMVENQELSRAVESLQEDIEREIGDDKTIGQYNLERELDSRGRTIQSAVSSALAKADNVKGDISELKKRTKEDDFKKNMRRDAVDKEDMEDALDNIDQLEQLVARLVLILKIYRDDRQLLRSGIDIQQQRANESEVMDMVKDMAEAQQSEFKSMASDMADELSERLERVIDDKTEASEQQKELMEQMQETAQELKEARQTPQKQVVEREQLNGTGNEVSSSSSDSGSSKPPQTVSSSTGGETSDSEGIGGAGEGDEEHPDLTEVQTELYNLVQNNPDKDIEWYADQMDQEERLIKMWRTKIQRTEGYEDFTLE
ncbi:hypothetical protein [Natrinema sp. H-ect4]|uniref:hypothetical protein n=1 Tax=Natrinema sp. H-ect4 TaxID=3242699 RepID=UPI0035A830F5